MKYHNLPLGLVINSIEYAMRWGITNPKLDTSGTNGIRLYDAGQCILEATHTTNSANCQIWDMEVLDGPRVEFVETKAKIARYRLFRAARINIEDRVANPFLRIKNVTKKRLVREIDAKWPPTTADRQEFLLTNMIYVAGGVTDLPSGLVDSVMAVGGYIYRGSQHLVGVNFCHGKRAIRPLRLGPGESVVMLQHPIDQLATPMTTALDDSKWDATPTNIKARCLAHNARRKKDALERNIPFDGWFKFFLFWNENGTTEWTRFEDK